MNRLKYYILNMRPNSDTYEEMYEGKMIETFIDKDPIEHNHAVYWDDEIGYEITKSNRLELSKPTITIHIPMKNLKVEDTSTAALDYIFRSFIPYIRTLNELNDNRKRTAKENGHYYIYEPNNKVLQRNVITAKKVSQKYYTNPTKNTITPIDGGKDVPAYLCANIMIQVQLPLGKHKKAVQMLSKDLPDAVNRFIDEFSQEGLKRALELEQKQNEIRAWLKESEYCAFVANGSILPREKGSDLPMINAIPFQSTKEDEVEVAGIKGMAFKKGVTVITGGGYSGKSTLLDALSAGIYNHIEGDGREFVITDDSAMKISAEDGRSVRHANLSPFIKWIPGGNPADFSTEHASGSTSQAANIIEAINWGVTLLMIDEDKSATNFMIQDPIMKALIEKEPITPFVERVQELSKEVGVSTILVIGGSSEYLQVSDRIYMMKDYQIHQVTEEAKQLQASCAYQLQSKHETIIDKANFMNSDEIDANYLTTYPNESSTEVLKVSDLGFLILGEEQVDIRMIHDIASIPQLNAIAFLLRKLINRVNPMERFQKFSFEKLEDSQIEPKWIHARGEVEQLLYDINEEGLESAYSTFFTECNRFMDLPRKYEVLAVLSRMRIKMIRSFDE
ncbi:P-loop domain-containing protein [Clostridium sp. Marseille-P299]|uniref:P-loop domain-containing protein n=1 Tax=Clostridium sp. Marseille-P299 TaxID=1805477 RepID=UPI00082B5C37|nr:P-loop domain-containing protein [Clostridium sp. Marseille-P299]